MMTTTIHPRDDLKLKHPLYYEILIEEQPDSVVARLVSGYAISKGSRRQYLDDIYKYYERKQKVKIDE